MGDPAGVGAEIIMKALKAPILETLFPLVIGDRGILEKVRRALGTPWPEEMNVLDLKNVDFSCHSWGMVKREYGRASGEYIEKAIELALKGEVEAVVTCPIQKEAFREAGYPYPGHTEMFARITGAPRHALMYLHGAFRVVHASLHVALKDVPSHITEDRVFDVITVAHEGLNALGIERPRIGVAGLNPHAGEGGLFGREEIEAVAPAVAKAKEKGLDVSGPFPADIIFSMLRGRAFDVVVAMYHDQGGIPAKLLGFEWDKGKGRWAHVQGVNVTLGLPIIRTSVIHGTAFDIAGRGLAHPGSLVDALLLASDMVHVKRGETLTAGGKGIIRT